VGLRGPRPAREYETASGGDGGRLGAASPFDVKVESPSLDSLTSAQVEALVLQHTAGPR
jgi:hypothetical protein